MIKLSIHTILSVTIVLFPALSFLSFMPLREKKNTEKWINQYAQTTSSMTTLTH